MMAGKVWTQDHDVAGDIVAADRQHRQILGLYRLLPLYSVQGPSPGNGDPHSCQIFSSLLNRTGKTLTDTNRDVWRMIRNNVNFTMKINHQRAIGIFCCIQKKVSFSFLKIYLTVR